MKTVNWLAEFRDENGHTETATITAVSYSAAKVCAKNGERDGLKFVRVARVR